MRAKYIRGTPAQRFWAKVDPCRTDGCALWVAALDDCGYGNFWNDGVIIKAHHFLAGKPPKGLEWDHVKARGCIHRNCVWPDHLELVSHIVNVRRGIAGHNLVAMQLAKTHCPQGHPYDLFNTHIRPRGGRGCRECDRIRHRESYLRDNPP